MGVETVSGLNSILRNHDASSWIQESGVESSGNLKIPKTDEINNRRFADIFRDSINEVNELQKEADTAIQKLVTGKSKNIHQTLLAVEKAEIAFKMMNQIRLKVIDAYREVMKMQI